MHTIDFRVYFEDTDAGGIVYYANYLKFTERARTEWLRELGYSGPEFALHYHAAFVVRKVSAEYLQPAKLDFQLRVVTGVLELKRYSLSLQQNLLNALDLNQTFCCTTVQLCCINTNTMRPLAIPSEIHHNLAKDVFTSSNCKHPV